jgi:hypothetical protein
MEILYRAGNAGVQPALEVYNSSNDEQLKEEIGRYLYSQKLWLSARRDYQWSLESHMALERLCGTEIDPLY